MDINQIRHFVPQLRVIARKYHISRVSVFGSIARGESTPQSDVDLLVEMQAGASLFNMAGFCYEAEKLLKVPVDVVPANLLPLLEDRSFATRIQFEAIAL
jgi:hypothetical protein